MTSTQREARLIKHYIRALGLHAVWRATDSLGRTETGLAQDVPAAERRLAERGLVSFDAWWVSSRAAAERALALIERGAPAPGMTSHAVVIARARQAIAQVALKVAAASRAGDLRHVNAAYRDLRRRRAALGLSTYPYATYLDRYTIRVLYQTAAQVRR